MTTVSTKRTKKVEIRPVVIRMPVELHEAIKRKAADEERSVAQTMRRALRQYASA